MQRLAEMSEDELASVTSGEMLKDEFLAEYRLSQSGLAKVVGISPNRIAEVVNNRRRITADTALRLGLYFGTSVESCRTERPGWGGFFIVMVIPPVL
jgi:addiction module HigA family antidote